MAAKWPVVLEMIADGSVTVTAVRLLSDVLTDTNHEELFRAARHKSKREVEAMIAALNPQPEVAASIRKVTRAGRSRNRSVVDRSAPLLAATVADLAITACTADIPRRHRQCWL